METKVCGYCGRTYRVETYHRTEGLTRYCSHGCRLAVEGYDYKNTSHRGAVQVSLNDPTDPAASEVYATFDGVTHLRADRDPAAFFTPAPAESTEPRLFDYVRRVVKTLLDLDTADREIALRRLNGESWGSVAVNASVRLRKTVTEKSAQKALASAVRLHPWMVPLFKSTVEKQRKTNERKQK